MLTWERKIPVDRFADLSGVARQHLGPLAHTLPRPVAPVQWSHPAAASPECKQNKEAMVDTTRQPATAYPFPPGSLRLGRRTAPSRTQMHAVRFAAAAVMAELPTVS